MMGLALLKNYNPFGGPPSLTLMDIMKKFDKSFGLSGKSYGKVSGDRTVEDVEKRRQDPWNFLFIAGMWFQDLFNYDFRRTEMCIIPYATQLGEISFCAYNTGHRLAEDHREHVQDRQRPGMEQEVRQARRIRRRP